MDEVKKDLEFLLPLSFEEKETLASILNGMHYGYKVPAYDSFEFRQLVWNLLSRLRDLRSIEKPELS